MKTDKWKKERKKLISLRESGMTYLKIADMYEISRQRIHQVFKHLEINALTPVQEKKKKAPKLYNLGLTMDEIAQWMGVTYGAVHYILKKDGVKSRRRTHRTRKMKEEAREFLKVSLKS